MFYEKAKTKNQFNFARNSPTINCIIKSKIKHHINTRQFNNRQSYIHKNER